MYYLSIFIAVVSFALSASAQITITEGSLAGIGTRYVYHQTGLQVPVDVGSPGEERVWDFSDIEFDLSYQLDVLDAAATPWGNQFSGAEICVKNTFLSGFTAAYLASSPQELVTIGHVSAIGDTDVLLYENPSLEIPFPLSYGSQPWTTVQRYEVDLGAGMSWGIVDSIRRVVDAWGTLTTDFGSTDVLRIHMHGWIVTIIPELPPDTSETDAYYWSDVYGRSRFSVSSNTTDTTITSGYVEVAEVIQLINLGRSGDFPVAFSLHPNYPNPFNPTTTIAFDLAERGFVTLNVFNIAGQLVATPVEGIMPAGSHHVMFDASKLASGVFFARLNARGESLTRKMILMR